MARADGITVARIAVVAVGAPVAITVIGAGAPVVADAVRHEVRVVAVVVAVSSLPKAGVLADGVARDRGSVRQRCLPTYSGQGEEEYAAAERRRQLEQLRPHCARQLPTVTLSTPVGISTSVTLITTFLTEVRVFCRKLMLAHGGGKPKPRKTRGVGEGCAIRRPH